MHYVCVGLLGRAFKGVGYNLFSTGFYGLQRMT